MTTQSLAWYVDFFRTDYLNIYGHLFTAERAERETVFVEKALQLEAGARVLDLCCGPGRHSVPLAQHGFDVTGLDLNPAYLELARQAAQAGHVSLKAVAADMREIPFHNYFDAIVNMFSSFGYLETETEDARVLESAAKALKPDGREDARVLESAAKALKPDGRLFLDMLNREWAIANYIQNDWHSGEDGTLYVERRDLDLATSRMHVRFTIVGPNGTRRESIGHNMRLYTLTEMTRLLERAGMRVTGVFGGFDGETYAVNTRRMILCARKI